MTGLELRRIFWIGAAGILILAALVAMTAIARGEFGDTDAKILGTLFVLLLAGATAIAGLALVERATLAAFGWLTTAVAGVAFAVVALAIWSEGDSVGWEWAARAIVIQIAFLLVCTQRLLLRIPTLLPLVVATAGAAALATFLTCVGIGQDNADGLWQLTAILWILTGLGYLLLPVLQRFSAAGGTPATVRIIAELDGVELIATHSNDGLDVRLRPGERLALRRSG